MKSWLYASSFKTRIWLSFVLFIVVSITISGMTSHYMASRILERKAMELSQNMINKSAQALEEKLRKVRLSALTITMNEPFNKLSEVIHENTELSYYERFSLTNALQNSIFQMKLMEPSISSVLIQTPIGEFYAESDKRIIGMDAENSRFYEQFGNKRLPAWLESHKDSFFEGKSNVLSLLARPVSSVTSGDIFVLVNVKEEYLRTYIKENLGPDSGEIIVYSDNGSMALDMESPMKALALQPDFRAELKAERGNFEYDYLGDSYLVNYAEVSFPDNWMIVNIQSLEKLHKEISLIKWITAGTIFIFVLLATFLSQKMTVLLLRPLIKLQNLMKRVEQNDLSVRYESVYEDEFTQVGRRFNRMLEEIGSLIHDVKEAETNKRKSEIKALQSQIDPHFLYNTLNTIVWKSETKEHDDVKEMIISLSLLFRLGLNNGNEITKVKQEIEHLTQYLLIQKQCYEDLFVYSIDIKDKDVLDQPILKLLLQPLVENSILHGFKDAVSSGVIRISIDATPTHLLLSVEDNGKGFDAEAVKSELTGGSALHKGYALRNVYNRLTLYYGKEASMTMESLPYERTVVKLAIPVRDGFDFS